MTAILVSAGRDTTLAVRRVISEFQSEDPLRAVRVIVSSNVAGLSLRRLLGSSALAESVDNPGRPGIANVSFATPFQLASEIAAPALAAENMRPLTTPVLAAAVRHVLASQSAGRFKNVAEHIATETALVRAYAEITELPPAEREKLRGSRTARTVELLTFIDAVEAHLTDGVVTNFHDEYAVLSRAATAAPAALADDRLVFVGPFSQGAATIDFLTSVARSATVTVVASLTGDREVDKEVAAQASRLSGTPAAPVTVAIRQPTEMIPVCDSDQEAQVVVREILAAADRGVRFDRMAVFVPVHKPYLRVVREHLDRAGIPSAGPNHRTLADSMTGRLLYTLLDLVEGAATGSVGGEYDRNDVMALVSAAPLRGPDARQVRSGAWEDISRSAGIVGGLDEWQSRLDAHIRSLNDRHQRQTDEGAARGYLSALEREATAADALAKFVEWLGGLTSPQAVGSSWAERSSWATETLKSLLPQVNKRSTWPEAELVAAERIEVLLARLSVLDEVEPKVRWSAFRRAIQLELDAPAGRRGAFGTGVFVAPLASAMGVDLDEVFVVGLAEGLSPRPIREDTLLPDSERQLVEGLSLRNDRTREQRERYLHAISGGARTTVTTPLGDHRTGRSRTVSRWWVEAVRARTGNESITSQSWYDDTSVVTDAHDSFQRSLTTAVRSASVVSEADLQMQYVHAENHLDSTVDPDQLERSLRLGLDLISERLNGYNRFNGNLRNVGVKSPLADGAAISPSRLQSWADCPRRFYFEQVLGLGEIDRPEQILEISALDRGSLIHAILEDFIALAIPGGAHEITSPDYRWTEADRERLHELAEVRFKEYEDLGRTGRPLLWEIQKEATRADLDAFIVADSDYRAKSVSRPHDVELPFGLGARRDRKDGDVAEAAEVRVGDRVVRLRGLVDRIDWRDSDGTPVVLDYKTGKHDPQSTYDTDPVVGGSKLQLGVYSEAVMQHYDVDSAQAYYWYATSKGKFKRSGYSWTGDRRARFVEALDTIVSGIEAGDFPPNPGEFQSFRGTFSNCAYCPFTGICPVDRDEELEKAAESGQLTEYLALREYDAEAAANAATGDNATEGDAR